ncbi:MAG: hypothetical protein L0Y70_06105 [Gemmataceae bacterium]|nr:hypothetical protein [Gemmataceae bacterium]
MLGKLPSAFAACAVWAALHPAADAQQIGSYVPPRVNRPTVSPYLQLGGSNNLAVNYFTRLRPQVETSQNLSQLQTQMQNLQAPAAQPQQPEEQGPGATGRGLGGFFFYGNYFPLMNRSGARAGSTNALGASPLKGR